MYQNQVTPKVQNCPFCQRGSAKPQIFEKRTNTEIVVEATWVCPTCGNKFKHGVISRTPIKHEKSA